MNFTKKIAVFALTAFVLVSCKKEDKNTTAATATEASKDVAAKMETASMNIEGMTCAMGCAATIENKLSHLEGVTSAKVDFETKTATVEFDANKQSTTSLTQTVEGVADGKTYKVTSVKSSGDKAMVMDQEPKKAEGKKCCSADAKKSCADKKGDAPKSCAADAKKDTDVKKA